METFTQEIQALATVSDHPNIVTLYRPLATPDGRPVLVLELCRESLAQRVRRTGPIGALEVTRIGIKIGGALETAHRHGFLHRDMKPQNILVTQFGEPALSDFGVAALQASAQATAGVFGFTTLHAAPEILEGHHLSPATDVYGLASTMYQLLTGLAPFATFDNEAPASVILRIIRDPVRPLRSEDIPLGLADLLEAALSKDPEGRPHSAYAFAEALVAVEAAAGWTPTAYVAWGEDRAAVTRPAPASPASVDPSAGRAALFPSAPSVSVPEVAVKRPALPPVSRPASPVASVSAAHQPDPPGAARPDLEASPGGGPLGPPALPLPPPLPPPPPPPPLPMRPSVAPPPTGTRNVVVPDQTSQGPQRLQGTPAPSAHPAPLRTDPTEVTLPTGRPIFVDPPTPAESGGFEVNSARSESVYEQTIVPSPGLSGAGRGSVPLAGEAHPGRMEQLLASPVLLACLAAAGAVVIAAVLLIVGVL